MGRPIVRAGVSLRQLRSDGLPDESSHSELVVRQLGPTARAPTAANRHCVREARDQFLITVLFSKGRRTGPALQRRTPNSSSWHARRPRAAGRRLDGARPLPRAALRPQSPKQCTPSSAMGTEKATGEPTGAMETKSSPPFTSTHVGQISRKGANATRDTKCRTELLRPVLLDDCSNRSWHVARPWPNSVGPRGNQCTNVALAPAQRLPGDAQGAMPLAAPLDGRPDMGQSTQQLLQRSGSRNDADNNLFAAPVALARLGGSVPATWPKILAARLVPRDRCNNGCMARSGTDSAAWHSTAWQARPS